MHTDTKIELGLGAIVVAALLSGASMAERLNRTAIDLRNVEYTGYRTEKSEGTVQVYFKDTKGKTGLINEDRSFNQDSAYRDSVANPNLRFNVSGYHSPIFGDFATDIRPVKK
ncbi:Uncharacterised protein [uncultured archaeon]|nr:Uncharacterised protein [uncultured archaeon]